MIIDTSRPAIPETLRRLMAELGPRWGKDDLPSTYTRQMTAEFSKLHASAPDDTSKVERDIAYGPHPHQRLDLFMPTSATAGRPLVVFVHGGAFVKGDKDRTPEIYSNVTRFFARHGIPAINMNYRLAPETIYPGASEDVASVVAWAQAQAGRLGVDASRIFLMGHSAGGAHAGSYAYDKRLQPQSGHGLAGLIIVSGRMRAETSPANPNARSVQAYYGADTEALDRASPVSHVDADSPATFIAIAEYENPLLDVHCLELAHRLAQVRLKVPPMIWLKGHNHTSTIAHINTAENTLGQMLLDFVEAPKSVY
jgi:acetyl esterase